MATLVRPFTVISVLRQHDAANQMIADMGTATTGLALRADSGTPTVSLRVNGTTSTNRVSTDSTTFRDGNWHCIVITAEAGDDRFWLDGVGVENGDTTSSDPVFANSRITIGSRNDTHGLDWRGDMGCFYVLGRGVLQPHVDMINEDPWGPVRFHEEASLFGAPPAVTYATLFRSA